MSLFQLKYTYIWKRVNYSYQEQQFRPRTRITEKPDQEKICRNSRQKEQLPGGKERGVKTTTMQPLDQKNKKQKNRKIWRKNQQFIIILGEGKDGENTWETVISCLLSVSGHYGQKRKKICMFKSNKKIKEERFSHQIFIPQHPREN